MRNATRLLILAALLGACGGATPTNSPSPRSSPSPTASPSPTPGSDVAVIRIAQVGGMMPPWISVNWYPAVVVYADGRLITMGPQFELYPGPALPNLQVTQLTQAGLAQVLTWAGQAGLVGPDRTLGEPILDSPVTVFTVQTDVGPHQTILQGINDDPAVQALLRFQDALLSVRSLVDAGAVVGDDVPFAWQRMQILDVPADPGQAPDPQLVSLRAWPLAPLATLGRLIEPGQGYRCAVIEGADADTLRTALEGANELTFWTSDDEVYQVTFHPLLPDESGCTGF